MTTKAQVAQLLSDHRSTQQIMKADYNLKRLFTPNSLAALLVETGIIPPCDEEDAVESIVTYYNTSN